MSLSVKRTQIAVDHHVFIVDQTSACRFAAPHNSTMIRIKGKNPTGVNLFFPLLHPETYSSVHEFDFDDVDISQGQDVVFDSDMAIRMVDIFEQYIESKKQFPEALLVIHCQAGISRSAAIACGFAQFSKNEKLERDIRKDEKFAQNFSPNARVYRRIFEEIDRRESKLRVGDIRRAIEDMPDHAAVNILLETGYAQLEERHATGSVSVKNGIAGQRFIVTYEFDLLGSAEGRVQDFHDREFIGRCVLGKSGIQEPEVFARYMNKIRKDWAERYHLPVPKDCPYGDHTILPEEHTDRHETGFTFYKWLCTWKKCEHNKHGGEFTKEIQDLLHEIT